MQTADNIDETWTVARLVNWTRGHFQARGLESPRLCAELLLAHAMKCERIQLYTQWDRVPDEPTRALFRGLVAEAGTHRPIAYLLGTKEFFSMEFDVTPDVLIPRPESEILVERTLEFVRDRGVHKAYHVLDLCTGSGCIAISIARHAQDVTLTASDNCPRALLVARRNATRHGVGRRITFYAGDLYSALPPSQRYDVIVCNPPYIAESEAATLPKNVRDYEPAAALFAGADGLAIIRRVIAGAPERLSPNGHLLMEIAYNQSQAVQAVLAKGDWSRIVSYRDLGGHERVVHATRSAKRETQVA